LAKNPRLARLVAQKLQLDWSPQQIAGWLEREFGNDEMRVSHETIYQVFVELAESPKTARRHLGARLLRHGRSYTTKGGRQGQIVDAVSIRERPAQVEDRAVPGHWEGDLIQGSHNTHIATLVERQSRFVMLLKVPTARPRRSSRRYQESAYAASSCVVL
jgi:IS30 family transposase